MTITTERIVSYELVREEAKVSQQPPKPRRQDYGRKKIAACGGCCDPHHRLGFHRSSCNGCRRWAHPSSHRAANRSSAAKWSTTSRGDLFGHVQRRPCEGTSLPSPNTATSLTTASWRRTGPCAFADTDIAFLYGANGNAAFKITCQSGDRDEARTAIRRSLILSLRSPFGRHCSRFGARPPLGRASGRSAHLS